MAGLPPLEEAGLIAPVPTIDDEHVLLLRSTARTLSCLHDVRRKVPCPVIAGALPARTEDGDRTRTFHAENVAAYR